jgi:hypothetical protein
MKRFLMAFMLLACIGAVPCFGAEEEHAAKAAEPHSILHKIVFYVPNRVLDVLDIVRFRVRFGPGIAADVRATEAASAFAGSYASVYAGLPGPRNRPKVKLPVGFESRSGLQASLIDATETGGVGPDYGPAEFGVGVQAAFIGLDVGIDPLEILDLAAGFFFIDVRGDDL